MIIIYARLDIHSSERNVPNCEIVNDQISIFKKIFSSDKRNYQTKSVIHDKDMHIYFYRPQLKKKKKIILWISFELFTPSSSFFL